jgi:hypothetical protein
LRQIAPDCVFSKASASHQRTFMGRRLLCFYEMSRPQRAALTMEQKTMKRLPFALLLGWLLATGPAAANHIFTPDPFSTKGDCEAENARLSNNDAERQYQLRPDLFSSMGEARSFMTRAFSCELNSEDGFWYLTDHRLDVINSEWFQRRR